MDDYKGKTVTIQKFKHENSPIMEDYVKLNQISEVPPPLPSINDEQEKSSRCFLISMG